MPGYEEPQVLARIAGIFDTALAIFAPRQTERRPTHLVADALARRAGLPRGRAGSAGRRSIRLRAGSEQRDHKTSSKSCQVGTLTTE